MTVPKTAMVLAAGLGTRMRPITLETPKPLVRICGRTLLDHVLDRLEAVGVETVIVNSHWKGEQVAAHLARRGAPRIILSPETELLETGGGVRHALPHLGERFFVVNSDVFWLDGRVPALERLARAWHDGEMDALLMMQRTTTGHGYDGAGDYHLDPFGRLRRRREREVAPFVFAAMQILHRRAFKDSERAPAKFSLNRIFDRAQEAGRLHGIVHDGLWYHVGTPADLAAAEARLAEEHGFTYAAPEARTELSPTCGRGQGEGKSSRRG